MYKNNIKVNIMTSNTLIKNSIIKETTGN